MSILENITGKTKITGVIGDNISYTKSPEIHNYWYDYHKIDGVYVCFNTDKNNFKSTIYGLFQAGIQGLNVTVPFKEKAFELCDIITSEAKNAQAVNCLTYQKNKIHGHNTDGIGFYNALRFLNPALDLNQKSILIIGAGGAASAIIGYLCQFNITIYVYNRTFEKAKALVKLFQNKASVIAVQSVPENIDIIVQTTSIKHVEPNSFLDLPDDIITHSECVIDINYGTDTGSFLEKPKKLGIKNCNGLEMLLQQAAPAFTLFNHQEISITDELRQKII